MHLTFLYPEALALLVLLPPLWVLTLVSHQSSRQRQPPGNAGHKSKIRQLLFAVSPRAWASLTLRMIALVALVLALAGAQVVQPVEDLTVAFLVDGSDSVAPDQREWARQFINTALEERDTTDQAAVVIFGQNALVEHAPAPLNRVQRFASIPDGTGTDIAEAIQLGIALVHADTQKRLVLLSDGEENKGRAIEAARLASARGVPLDVIPLPSRSGEDVVVEALEAPATAREGQAIVLQTHIRSSIETSGQLQIFADDELIESREVAIAEGTTTIPVGVSSGEPGFHRYEARLEAPGDTQASNNRAAAFTTVEGPPRVLLVASEESRAAPLQRALEQGQAEIELRHPRNVPAAQEHLKPYAAIILVDVLAHDVPHALKEALPHYVREQGGSLAMLGGRESFGAGGWRRSQVAEVLPVKLEREDTLMRPDLGLVMVIDRSGSMTAQGSSGGISSLSKLDLAKEAVYQATLGMERNDQVGVVAFDTSSDWVLPVQTLPNLGEIEFALGMLTADGGTNIRSGIEPAAAALATIDAKNRHVILLTDGQAASNYADLITGMRDDGITITVVSIGSEANPELRQIAEQGGGRYYRVTTLSDVPRIFLAETIMVAGRDIVEETIIPVVALPAPIVRSLDRIPPLYGYNVTDPRPTARTILATPDGKPILAQWQYGLGRGVAWTSDMKGQWAAEWVAWEQFPQFANSLLTMLLPPQQAEGVELTTRTEGNRAIFDLRIEEQQKTAAQSPQIEGRLLDPENRAISLDFEQVSATRYRAVVPVETPGSYLARVAVVDSEGQASSISSGLVVSYSPEYSARGTNPNLPADLASTTGGRLSPEAAAVFASTSQPVGVVQEVALPLLWLALLLLPLDVALRRFRMRRSDLRALLGSLRKQLRRVRKPAAQPQPTELDITMARLRAAKNRAWKREQENPPDDQTNQENNS